MNLYFFGRDAKVPPSLETVQRSRTFHFEARDLSTAEWRSLPEDAYVYVSLQGVKAADEKALLDTLSRTLNGRFGVVDPGGRVDDPVLLLARGARDYLGPGIAKTKLPTKRFVELLEPIEAKPRRPEDAPGLTLYKPSGAGWGGVEAGSEYTFGMLFAHLDETTIRRETLSSQRLEKTTRLFRDLLEQNVDPFGGRIWIWRDTGGLVLFPFDGSTSAGILPALRMHLNRRLIAVEEFAASTEVSFRLVHHIGSTEYRPRGRTGTVVSDAVNIVFHIGDRYAPAGSMVATDTSMHFATSKLRKFFRPDETFEGRRLFRPRF